jgi:hypothetical protein
VQSDQSDSTQHGEDCTCASCDPGRLGFKLSAPKGVIEVKQSHPDSTDFGSVSDMLTDEEREESLRARISQLTEIERIDGCVMVDLDEFRFLLRLLDEARAESITSLAPGWESVNV